MTDFISTRLFPEVLNMSLTGSIIILAVLVIRFFLHKAPKRWSYLLWLVVAFRLACPVSLPSPVSLLGAVNAPVTTEGTIEYIPQTIVSPQTPTVSPVTPTPGTVTPDTVAPAPQFPSAPDSISAMDILPVVWLVGIAVVLIYSVVSYQRLRRRLSEAILYHDNVWQSDRVQSPFILGLFRPRIYIPFGLDEQTLSYVLAHEHCHLKRKDHIIKPLAFLLLTLHWFNPLCWLAFHLMGRDMEMSCDEQVLAQENGDRKVYSTALLSFAANRRFPAPSPLAFGEGEVRPRITNALNWKAPKVWVTAVAGVLCVVVLLLCALNPNSAPTQVAPGHCTVTHNSETTKYRMKQQPKPFYGDMSAVYDTLDLPRAAVKQDDIITFYVEAEDSPELKVTEYYHYTLDNHEEFLSGRTRTLLREENGGFSLRVYPRGEGSGDYIIYQIQRDEGGYYTFRADISASDMTGAYASVQDFLDQTMAAEKVAYHFTSGFNPDGGAATAPANVTGTKLMYLNKKGEFSGLAPKGTLEAWESFYLVALDVASDQVVLAGGQYEEDGWYNLDGSYNVVALRYEDGSCDILNYERIGGDNMDFLGERTPEEALHDWYVKAYNLTDIYPPYVIDWPQGEGMSFARRYDCNTNRWSVYIPVNTWYLSGEDSWHSAYNTGATLNVSNSTLALNEQLRSAQAEGHAVTDEGNCYRIDYEHSSIFLYPHPAGAHAWSVYVQWPAAPSQDPYAPSPEQEREELFRMARSLVLRNEEVYSFETSNIYDLNHNGILESYKMIWDSASVAGTGDYRVSIIEDGLELWRDYAGTTHAAWNTIFAVKVDGEDYLLRYVPEIGTGIGWYMYELFSLDEDGEEVLLKRNEVEFDLNFGGAHRSFDPAAIAAFLEEVHSFLNEESELLLSTDGGSYRSGGSGAAFDGDKFWGDSYDNSDKSLEEILRLYAEEMSKIQY